MHLAPAIVAAALLCSAATHAQNVREPVLACDPAGPATRPAIASDGDVSAIVFKDTADQSIQVVTSDGRGLAWSAPVRVDHDLTGAYKYVFDDSVAVVGDHVYVYWTDRRLAGGTVEDVYFNYSTDGGATFQPADILIPKGLPNGANDVKDIRMAVAPRPGANPDHLVAFLMAVHNDLTGMEELYLNDSTDSGRTFLPAAMPFTAHNGSADVDGIALAVDEDWVHGVFLDDTWTTPYNHLWYSRLDVATATLVLDTGLTPNTLLTHSADGAVAVDVDHPRLVVVWEYRDLALGGGDELWSKSTVDFNGGWTMSVPFGGYAPGVDDVDNPDVVLAANGNHVAVWEDDRSGSDEIYSAVRLAGNLFWEPDVRHSVAGGGWPMLGAADNAVAAAWTTGIFPNYVESVLTTDGGETWLAAQALSSSANTGDADYAVLAFNAYYGNFVMAWLGDLLGGNDVYAGGYRPQTLSAEGDWTLPGAQVRLAVDHWPDDEYGWSFLCLLSGTPGDILITRNGDMRNTGLGWDPLFQQTAGPYPYNTGWINFNGRGETPWIAIPAGLPDPLYATALGWRSPPLELGALTDVLLIPTQ